MVEQFIKDFTKAATENGINQLQYYVETTEKMGTTIYEGKVEEKQISQLSTCYIEGEYQGNKGYIYVEDFSPAYFLEHIENIRQIATSLKVKFVPKNIKNKDISQAPKLSDGSELEKILLEAEKIALENTIIKKVPICHGEEIVKTIRLENSKGDKMEETVQYIKTHIEVSAEENETVQTIGEQSSEVCLKNIKLVDKAKQAAKDAKQLINAKPIKTGNYSVILKNSIITEMLDMYLSAFCGDNVRKKLSKLSEQKDQQIASKLVMLQELPNLEEGINSRSFDDEGTTTLEKNIIEEGILKTFIYSEEEAKLANKKSTGNGFKSTYKASVGIGVTNLKLSGTKEESLEQLIKDMKEGLYIISCDGMFAGADPVSGNFSLISKGYKIENGEIKQGVNQITVAGNFYEMLKNIVKIGNDHTMNPHNLGAIIAPSIEISSLVVSGL